MKQQGFTLIELMIVIAIVGILLSLAAPAYRDYMVRARVTEGLTLAEGAKLAVAETAMSHTVLPANQEATGYVSAEPASKYVQSIKIGANGVITIRYTPAAGNGTIVLMPRLQEAGGLTWSCNTGTLPKRYRPADCR